MDIEAWSISESIWFYFKLEFEVFYECSQAFWRSEDTLIREGFEVNTGPNTALFFIEVLRTQVNAPIMCWPSVNAENSSRVVYSSFG